MPAGDRPGPRKSPLKKIEQLLRMVRKNAEQAGPGHGDAPASGFAGGPAPARDTGARPQSLAADGADPADAGGPLLSSYGAGLPSLPVAPNPAGARGDHAAPAPSGSGPLQRSYGSSAESQGGDPPSREGPSSFPAADAPAHSRYSVLREDLPPVPSGPPRGGSGASVSEAWAPGKQVVGETLKQFLKGAAPESGLGGSAPDERGGAAVSPAAVPDDSVYHALKKSNANRLDDVLDEQGGIRNLIFESRDALIGKARDANEMMTIDVVGMIFEFILRDDQVPSPVRAELGRLQLLLLKTALLDPQLLTQHTHPARELINRVGTVSQGAQHDDSFSERLTGEIRRIVEVLLQDIGEDSREVIFRLLLEFKSFVSRELQSGDAGVERAISVVEAAEQRSAFFMELRARLRKVFSTVKTDPYLRRLIEDWWLPAIEKAQNRDPALARRYRLLVPELVWSILEKRTERDRSQLLALLPGLLADFKNGLDEVKCAEKNEFLSWLIDHHTRAIKAVGIRSELLSLAWIQQQFEVFTNPALAFEDADPEPAATAVEFHRRMMDDAIEGLKTELRIDGPILQFGSDLAGDVDGHGDDEPGLAPGDADAETRRILERLSVGVPVEVNLDGTSRTATLNWMSMHARHMILSLESVATPTMVTVRLFRRLLANGRTRFLEAAPLFERAVNALLETADQVDEIFE